MFKDYLNRGIIGGNAGIASRRGFRRVPTGNIDTPDYNSSFFEAFPTVWANAYSFHRGLEKKEAQIIEEWIVLLSLHYFAVVHLETVDQSVLKDATEYDWDLWKSLSITYPQNALNLSEVKLLKFDKTVIGAYYPTIIFFPSRERSAWLNSEKIRHYLSNKKLSWEKFFEVHLKNDPVSRRQLHEHLLAVKKTIEGVSLQENLEKFCREKFGEPDENVKKLDSLNPDKWKTFAKRIPDSSDLLEKYPLKKYHPETGKTTYYLLTDFPTRSPWMNINLGNGYPSPIAYSKSSANNEILVTLAGQTIKCKVPENDEIKLLKDFFLAEPPSWCFITDNSFIAKVSSFNRVAVNSPDRDNHEAYCLLPIKSDFLAEFPELFDEENISKIKSEPLPGGAVRWKIPVRNHLVEFEATPELNKALRKTTAAIYPPQASPAWKIYAIHGTLLANAGGWHLIDEQGNIGTYQQIKDDEYVSICNSADGFANRPRAMLYIDNNKKENGVLILKKSEIKEVSGERMANARLAVDFGTSNTCLAFKINEKKNETLRFTMPPLFLWGEPSSVESPGFVPKQWGGEKGFFSTALFSLKKFKELSRVTNPDQLTLEQLFQVDLPSLHKGIEDDVARGAWDDIYEVHLNLKWGASESEPWRSLFLRSVLFYAHAEMFFVKNAVIEDFVFTYPLAFGKVMKDQFHESSIGAAKWIRNYCYNDLINEKKPSFYQVDESTAIAKSIDQEGQPGLVEVFIDIGGGTSDLAIRHAGQFEVLDSFRVAGNAFLDFTEKNFTNKTLRGAETIRKDLGELLTGAETELEISEFIGLFKDNLRDSYSFLISSKVNDAEFAMRENKILPENKSPSNRDLEKSYQAYRAKLFFKHIFTYSLIQLTDLIINKKITSDLEIRFILGGNGWGLLLFAGWRRSSEVLVSQINQLLRLLKERYETILSEEEFDLIKSIKISDVDLLNYRNLSDGKTKVALGALNVVDKEELNLGVTSPFTGIDINNLKINDFQATDIDRSERWNVSTLQSRLKDADGKTAIFETINRAELLKNGNPNLPLDNILAIFTAIGNESNLRVDNMPSNEWTKMNGILFERIKKMQINNERLTDAPINQFLSEILYAMKSYDYLDKLAEVNNKM